jgi:hypothetical protein
VAATASSGLTVSLTSQTASICSVSNLSITLLAVGICTVQANQPGNASYSAAAPVTQSFSVVLGGGGGGSSEGVGDGPLPLWALLALGAGLWVFAERSRRKPDASAQ